MSIDDWNPKNATRYEHVQQRGFIVYGDTHNTEEFYRIINPFNYKHQTY